MSGVIVDENRCMQRLYVDICEKHSCRAKVYPKTDGDLKRKIRSTDMVILLTNTLSPKMKEVTVLTKRHNAIIELPHFGGLKCHAGDYGESGRLFGRCRT